MKHDIIHAALNANHFVNYPAIVTALIAASLHSRHDVIWTAVKDLDELLSDEFDVTKNACLAAQEVCFKLNDHFLHSDLENDNLNPEQQRTVESFTKAALAMIELIDSQEQPEA
ncbi:hypothetical protein [Vibrio agarivorans]|uniref:hypothetical protein n=1 Tax=Vibrio agarivorans TaxID=153622 RepID=UPI0025B41B42|nr:hypothetical protein [Vibrio agarivorans]MDN3661042.1 hypothetical protein [Vibrio agarivorans]